MEIIGVIAEYNPFHKGHLYHINNIKEMYPDSIIIAVISTHFTQRGIPSILNKWDKTKICLDNNIDIVVELPFVFSSQGADIFSYASIKILNELGVKKIIFGSESNDVDKLIKLANEQTNNKEYDLKVKKYLDEGINYPTAMSKALSSNINTPNDILGICYIKEILKNNYDIIPITIKRTNDYNSLDTNSDIISATAIRNLINENKDIEQFVPKKVSKYVYKNIDYFDILKYKIISDSKYLNKFKTVDEGIENRILKYINKSKTLEELINNIKSKRYTYNKINRMFIHILTSFTKEEANNIDVSYIRVLGFNKNGKSYLNKQKKNMNIPLITGYKKYDLCFDIEYRATLIYSMITHDNSLIDKELKGPIIK